MEYRGITFSDCTVDLDNNSFIDCKFDNVVFKYAGATFDMVGCEINKPRFALHGDLANGLEQMRKLAHAGGPKFVKAVVDGITHVLRSKGPVRPTIQ